MKIHSLVYERSKDDQRIRQTAKLEVLISENEDPDIILDWMTARIHNDLGINSEKLEKELDQLAKRKRELTAQIEGIDYQASQAKERWEKIKAFFVRLNIPLPECEDIPF